MKTLTFGEKQAARIMQRFRWRWFEQAGGQDFYTPTVEVLRSVEAFLSVAIDRGEDSRKCTLLPTQGSRDPTREGIGVVLPWSHVYFVIFRNDLSVSGAAGGQEEFPIPWLSPLSAEQLERKAQYHHIYETMLERKERA